MIRTIHVQTGPFVYFHTLDSIVPNDQNLWAYIREHPELKDEVVGSAQGRGVETLWADDSNKPVDNSSTASELKERSHSMPIQPKTAKFRYRGSNGSKPRTV